MEERLNCCVPLSCDVFPVAAQYWRSSFALSESVNNFLGELFLFVLIGVYLLCPYFIAGFYCFVESCHVGDYRVASRFLRLESRNTVDFRELRRVGPDLDFSHGGSELFMRYSAVDGDTVAP